MITRDHNLQYHDYGAPSSGVFLSQCCHIVECDVAAIQVHDCVNQVIQQTEIESHVSK